MFNYSPALLTEVPNEYVGYILERFESTCIRSEEA